MTRYTALHCTAFYFTALQSIIPSSLLFGNMVSPRAHSLLKLSADFITDRVMPVEATVLAHTYVQQSATPPHINSTASFYYVFPSLVCIV
jgi:hypothetical protein